MKKRVFILIVLSIVMLDMLAPAQQPVTVAGFNSSFPCRNPANTRTPFNKNFASATAQELVPATMGKTGYICKLSIFGNSASNAEVVNIIEGTQMTNPCDAGTPTALLGSTTAANGVLVASGGGGNVDGGPGSDWIYKTTGTNRQICALTSGSNRMTFVGIYVVQ
jgi:hypothetical protein